MILRIIEEQKNEINTGKRCLHRSQAQTARYVWEGNEHREDIDEDHPLLLQGWKPGKNVISPIRRAHSAPNQLHHTEASLILKEETVSQLNRGRPNNRQRAKRSDSYGDYRNM